MFSTYLRLVLRYSAVGALALSGVGLFYLLAKTCVVKDGFTGISYNQGRINVLEPGMHLLLSPFNFFQQWVSKQEEVTEFSIDNILTPDNTPLRIKANLTWNVADCEKVMTKVSHYRQSLINTAKGTLTNILRSIELEKLLPASTEAQAMPERAVFQQIHNQFIEQLSQQVHAWGIEVKNIVIDDISITDIKIQEALAERAAAKARAAAAVLDAGGNAQAKIILANAEIEVAKSLAQVALQLDTTVAQDVYRLELTRRTAAVATTSTLIPAGMSLAFSATSAASSSATF
jgi:regulator of protease activity HflC (stomatin/prohibitin superfamily)